MKRCSRTTPLHERLAGAYAVTDAGCWQLRRWLGADGYGRLRFHGQGMQAHRLSYELHVGPIPEGLVLDHLCRNRACVNPDHLEPVTMAENTRRGDLRKPQRTHCKHGHPFTKETTMVRPDWHGYGMRRECRVCATARMRVSQSRRRDEAALRLVAS